MQCEEGHDYFISSRVIFTENSKQSTIKDHFNGRSSRRWQGTVFMSWNNQMKTAFIQLLLDSLWIFVFFIHWSLWLQLQRTIVTIVSHIVTNLRLFNRKCSVQNSQVVKEIKSASCSIISIKRPTKVAFQLVTVLTFRVQSFMVDQDPCISNICPLPVL